MIVILIKIMNTLYKISSLNKGTTVQGQFIIMKNNTYFNFYFRTFTIILMFVSVFIQLDIFDKTRIHRINLISFFNALRITI